MLYVKTIYSFENKLLKQRKFIENLFHIISFLRQQLRHISFSRREIVLRDNCTRKHVNKLCLPTKRSQLNAIVENARYSLL